MSISQNFPNIDPTLRLNFQGARRLDPRITFTRSSTATYVDEDGLIKTAAADEARFDYDPDTGESLGLLIEEGRTNSFTYSNFAQSTSTAVPTGWDGWNPAAFLTSQTLSPDGVSFGLFHGAINTNGGGLRKDLTGLTAGGTYYLSYYVKGLTTDELTYFTNNNSIGTTTGTAIGASNFAWFAATKVKFACSNLNGTGASGQSQVALTTDWQRVGTVVQADSAGSARIIISNNVGDVGSGNEDEGGTWMIWGAQIEAGSFQTSYIPTSGSTFTRQPDNASITGTNFTDFYSGISNSSIFVECVVPYTEVGLDPRLLSFRPLSGNASYDISLLSSQIPTLGLRTALNIIISSKSISPKTSTKISARLSPGDLALSCDGENAQTSTYTLTDNFNALDIGAFNSSPYRFINSTIKQLIYYPARISDIKLEQMTKNY